MAPPTTSIVILTRNQRAFTQACVDSIVAHTSEPFELVFVDNGSTDGTQQYLRSIDGAVVIENVQNLGFGGGCNQGIAAATGDRLLLLNNDVVVTPGWLAALHAALDSSPGVGIAGPRSNRAAGLQQVDEPGYDVDTLVGVEEWAAQWAADHAGQLTEVPRVIGFCMLLERAVVDRIGGFDLRYGIGNFEDDDLCLRACVGGFRSVVAHGSWVHHAGGRTFAGEGVDYRATLRANLARFRAAWQLGADEVDPQTGAYDPTRICRLPFDPRRHYAPLVGVAEPAGRVQVEGARSRVLAVCADRLAPADGIRAVEAALRAYGPRDDVTVAIRIDPSDAGSAELLEQVADRIGDEALPDVVLVSAPDHDDRALLQAADALVVHGRFAGAHRALARHVGVPAVELDELVASEGPRLAA